MHSCHWASWNWPVRHTATMGNSQEPSPRFTFLGHIYIHYNSSVTGQIQTYISTLKSILLCTNLYSCNELYLMSTQTHSYAKPCDRLFHMQGLFWTTNISYVSRESPVLPLAIFFIKSIIIHYWYWCSPCENEVIWWFLYFFNMNWKELDKTSRFLINYCRCTQV